MQLFLSSMGASQERQSLFCDAFEGWPVRIDNLVRVAKAPFLPLRIPGFGMQTNLVRAH